MGGAAVAKYYRISLNCARVRTIGSVSKDYGFIRILPLKGTITKKSFFGIKHVPVIEYEGHFSVIVEQVDDYFEDIVLRRKIFFDPNGLRDVTSASFDELISNLNYGLTCFCSTKIEPEVALYYKNIIESDVNILNKYKSELAEIARKETVIAELVKRLDLENSSKDEKSNNDVKKRILNKSA